MERRRKPVDLGSYTLMAAAVATVAAIVIPENRTSIVSVTEGEGITCINYATVDRSQRPANRAMKCIVDFNKLDFSKPVKTKIF